MTNRTDKQKTEHLQDILKNTPENETTKDKPYPDIKTNIIYKTTKYYTKKKIQKSVVPIGLDTESDTNGKCFMIAFSDKTVVEPAQIPAVFFSKKFSNKTFIAYNLKYDMGAILQCLPRKSLKQLQRNEKCTQEQYEFQTMANKVLIIRKGKKSVHIYDAYNFFNTSLQKASKMFLNSSKKEIETMDFTKEYIDKNWYKISEYCIQDAILVRDLMLKLIKSFEEFNIYPRKLYSVAYISALHFKKTCPYVHVQRYFDKHPEMLQFAMDSYSGGKFEIVQKGTGYFYEYDIVSAYPYSISRLKDIRHSRVVESKKYLKTATYGFLDCKIKIPVHVFSPLAVKTKGLNKFPVGYFRKTITNTEYDFLVNNNVDIEIIKGYWLMTDYISYPYKKEIERLVKLKKQYKEEKNIIQYHNIKLLMNSFYGKFVQMIYKDSKYNAGNLWNCIYSAIITAESRIRVSEMQNKYPGIIAVHTDSIISDRKIDINTGSQLGDFEFVCEGQGIMLGTGVYQIGSKSKIRGFETQKPLIELIPKKGKKLKFDYTQVLSWREVAHRKIDISYINRFIQNTKEFDLCGDTKRIWLNDYKGFEELFQRNVSSLPTIE